MIFSTLEHYEALIDENNDPVLDPKPLQEYMNRWDGPQFIECLQLSHTDSVLEIGVGTGRLALRTAPLCSEFFGIDLSPKTIHRARKHLSHFNNVHLICADFTTHLFPRCFDVIYSSLTFMHIGDKRHAIEKIASLLTSGGRFVLSIDKNQDHWIDMGSRMVKIFPDDPEETRKLIGEAGLCLERFRETDFAYILAASKE